MGIIVLVMLVIVGLITCFFYDGFETKIFGNTSYLGWVLLISGILLSLIGLGTWGGDEETGPDGRVYKKKHDFFWIPILIWGILFLGIGIYLKIFVGSPEEAPETTTDTEETVVIPDPTTRTVNFYNTAEDTVRAIVADDVVAKGMVFNQKIKPNSIFPKTLDAGTYMFMSSANGEGMLKFPPENPDLSKFKLHEDEKGKFYQRILAAETADESDYDEAWVMVDGHTALAVVAIDIIMATQPVVVDNVDLLTEDDIVAVYPGTDLIEPMLNNDEGKVLVSGPADDLKYGDEQDRYFALIPYSGDNFTIEFAKKYLRKTKF